MALQAPTTIGSGEVPQCQDLGPAQPMQKVAQPQHLVPDGHLEKLLEGRDLLQKLTGFHITIAFVHLALGGYLLSTVKNLHLVVLKCWYPFWGAVSFLISGIMAMTTRTFPSKTSLKILSVTANIVSLLCALAGFYLIAKDLFLESPFLWPIWRPYPNPTAYIQRLELALFCFTCLEIFLAGPTAITICRMKHLCAEDKGDCPLDSDAPMKREGVTGATTML
ncbi:membrane-spanning 4-domains subfamily A member 10 isoform X1 [Psammomys obesus]|uniref:membrane-spanning 4-domains subfamily A member 10 isoform X1 n=1 Tax=Psammomys obesus TaxID=48139 RepID=UPI002452F51E|nr:membrane-spanning 4-domains subfamily A member 10 isoform X1 [Psammomys obesus]XP_055469693.1 membrane-spanning 4-domains subfamily A member 10 isoform X1 [Psammomys obesus]XP_055469694.1 membrane-spanning 4-domains subfamily A member 10 isoform X1 [Psammomys obesus]